MSWLKYVYQGIPILALVLLGTCKDKSVKKDLPISDYEQIDTSELLSALDGEIRYFIPANKSHSRPATLKKFSDAPYYEIEGIATLTESSKYCIFSDCKWYQDQKDWNKLVGIDFGLRPAENTLLIGWRWNTVKNNFEVVPYINVGPDKQPIEDKIIDVNPGEELEFRVFYSREQNAGTIELRNLITDQESTYTSGPGLYKESQTWGYLVRPYFGGSSKAPSDIRLELQFKK